MNSEYAQNASRENSIEQRKSMEELKRMNQSNSALANTPPQMMQPIVIQCDLPQAMDKLTEQADGINWELEEIRKHPSFANCKSEEEVIAQAQSYAREAGRVAGLENENNDLKTRLKEFEDKAAADEEAARKALLDAAEADGRINAEMRPVYENILKSNPEEGEKALKALAPKRKVMEDLKVDPGDESPWSKRMKEINNKLNKQ